MLTARTSILVTGTGLAALLAVGSTLPAQDAAVDEADSLADIEPAASGFYGVDDPIWPVKRGIDPAADRILRDWSEYLASAAAFTVTLEIAEEVLLPHGQMIQYGGVSEVAVQRPGSLHARFRGEERRSNVIIHDGRCTMLNLESNIYTVTGVPTLLDDAIVIDCSISSMRASSCVSITTIGDLERSISSRSCF